MTDMAERFPLIYNPIANQIQELPEGDTLAGSSGGSILAGTVIKYPDKQTYIYFKFCSYYTEYNVRRF